MDKKNILIVTHGFYPEQFPRAFRATELAKELCRQGHSVTVMAPDRPGVEKLLNEYPIQFKGLGKETWSIFNFKSLGFVGRVYNKTVNRLAPLLFSYPWIEMYFKVKKKLKKENGKYDALISIAVPYPIHWGVAAVWKKRGDNCAKVWIADCGDPYCLQDNDTFKPPFYFRWIEKWFMRKTDFVTVPTKNSYKGYFTEFHPKLRVIPQGFRFEDTRKQEEISDGVVRFGYGGMFIPAKRDPREMLEYLIGLPEEKKFEFHIFTTSPQFVQPFAERDKRIVLHQPVKREELLYHFSSYQFVVNFANAGTSQTPSKLIDYVIIDKPILEIQTGRLDMLAINEFLMGEYDKQHYVENPRQYRIENVVVEFLSLSN
jgi:hypothetical protein